MFILVYGFIVICLIFNVDIIVGIVNLLVIVLVVILFWIGVGVGGGLLVFCMWGIRVVYVVCFVDILVVIVVGVFVGGK